MSEHSVGGAGAAQVGMPHNWAPPDSSHVAMLRGGKAIWVQTGVIIEQRGAVCLPGGQGGYTNPVTVCILRARKTKTLIVEEDRSGILVR